MSSVVCEDSSGMVSVNSHQSQELVVPGPSPEQPSPSHSLTPPGSPRDGPPASPSSPSSAPAPGPVNAITVLTLLDKLVNMLDTVQENQHKMEGRQAEMEGAVRGIQADMTKLSKSHTHTSNTVSKLLDKSRKVSVTMKEVRDRMERQAGQVKKLEANHAHLLKRNNFKVLIFQEENEIPSSVFVKEPVPFPREPEESEESAAAVVDTNRSTEEGLHTIDLSSDEDVGLEAEGLEDDGLDGLHELEHLDKSRTEKIKRSSLKKVDSLKKAFSRQNIEKRMNKIVSQEKRDKIKKSLTPTPKSPGTKTSGFKVSPLTFSLRKAKPSEAHPDAEVPEASTETEVSPEAAASIELSPVGSPDQDLPFTEVHSQLAPELEEETKAATDALEKEEPVPAALPETNGIPEPEEIAESEEVPGADELPGSADVAESEEIPESDEVAESAVVPEAELSVAEEGVGEEGVSEEYALSATLPQEVSQISSPFTQEEMEEEEEEKEEEKMEEPQPVEQKKEPVAEVQKEGEQEEEKEKEEASPVEVKNQAEGSTS